MTVLDEHPASTSPLSTAMRDGSQVEHEAAENSAFMAELLGGRVNEPGYADYLLRLRRRLRRHGVGRPRPRPTTPRSPPSTTPPSSGSPRSTPTSTTGRPDGDPHGRLPRRRRRTAARLEARRRVGRLYVAHHYTRYLGDLSGGQAIGRILDREFELDGAGIAFYDFPEIAKPKPTRTPTAPASTRSALSAEEKARIVDEVKVAFGLNQALFAELGQNLAAYAPLDRTVTAA